MTSVVFRQNDKAWGSMPLGENKSRTIGRAGCLLTCYAQAMVDLGVSPQTTPRTLQQNALIGHTASTDPKRKIFIGPNIIQPRMAEFCGLHVGDVVRPPQPKSEIYQAIVTGLRFFGRVVIGVSHDDDPENDHFVLARRIEENELVVADPATGQEERIDLTTFEGAARWSDDNIKKYRLVSARPLGRRRA